MASKKKCVTCGKGFIAARADARTCSTACRSKAYRRAGRSVTDDTARAPRGRSAPDASKIAPVGSGGHCPEALAVLAGLDAELAQNSKRRGLKKPLVWSTAEMAVREMIADTIDRRTALQRVYEQCEDARLVLSISAEMRLLEGSVARLLKQINTDMPATPSRVSQRASHAALVRHHGPGAS